MKWLMILSFLLLPAFAGAADSSKIDEGGPDHILKGRLLDADGTPCANALILPIGVSRGGFIQQDQAQRNPSWHYRTDAEGRFTVRVGHFINNDNTEKTSSTLGWGDYHFIATPGPDDAGAVSECFANPRQWREHPDGKVLNEWGAIHYLGDKPLEFTMRRQRGARVEGQVVDKAGRPVPGARLFIHHDLHFDSHTGFGGEIFERKTEADAQGRYVFPRVYPKKFYISASGPEKKWPDRSEVWLRTRVGEQGEWQADRIYEHDFDSSRTVCRIDFGLEPPGQFVFEGTVTDERGRPVPGAEVALGYAPHTDSYSDSHARLATKTDSGGRFVIRCDYPWIRYLSVKKEGFADQLILSELEAGTQGRRMDPGRYDIQLKAGGAKKSP